MANIEMIKTNQVNDFGCEDYEKITEYKATYKDLELDIVTTETNINAVATIISNDPKLLDDIYMMFDNDGGYELFRDNNYLDVTSWGYFGDDIQIIKDLKDYLTALENRYYYEVCFGSGLAWLNRYIVEVDEETTNYQWILDIVIDYLTIQNDNSVITDYTILENDMVQDNEDNYIYNYDGVILGGNECNFLKTFGVIYINPIEKPQDNDTVIKGY